MLFSEVCKSNKKEALLSSDSLIRLAALKLGVNKQEQARLLKDSDKIVRASAVALGGLTKKQIQEAFNDEQAEVRREAVRLDSIDFTMLPVARADYEMIVRIAAIEIISKRQLSLF